MLDVDWVFAWKVASIFFTGAFGILALLTKYKDDNGRVTKWGKVSLTGIIVSTVLGAAAQIKESSDKETAAMAQREQMLRLVSETQRSVEGIERALDKLAEPSSIEMVFEMPCLPSLSVCEQRERIDWADMLFPASARIDAKFSLSQNGALPFDKSDWLLGASFSPGNVIARRNGSSIRVIAEVNLIDTNQQTGVLKSYRDLPKTHMNVFLLLYHIDRNEIVSLKPLTATIAFKDGRSISAIDFQKSGQHLSRDTYAAQTKLDVRLTSKVLN